MPMVGGRSEQFGSSSMGIVYVAKVGRILCLNIWSLGKQCVTCSLAELGGGNEMGWGCLVGHASLYYAVLLRVQSKRSCHNRW